MPLNSKVKYGQGEVGEEIDSILADSAANILLAQMLQIRIAMTTR